MTEHEKQRLTDIIEHIAELLSVMSAEDRGYILGVAETLAHTVYTQPPEPKKTA